MNSKDLSKMSNEDLVTTLINSVQEWEVSKGTKAEVKAFEAIAPFEKELLCRLAQREAYIEIARKLKLFTSNVLT